MLHTVPDSCVLLRQACERPAQRPFQRGVPDVHVPKPAGPPALLPALTAPLAHQPMGQTGMGGGTGTSHLAASQQLRLPAASTLHGFTPGTRGDADKMLHDAAMRKRRIAAAYRQAESPSAVSRHHAMSSNGQAAAASLANREGRHSRHQVNILPSAHCGADSMCVRSDAEQCMKWVSIMLMLLCGNNTWGT